MSNVVRARGRAAAALYHAWVPFHLDIPTGVCDIRMKFDSNERWGRLLLSVCERARSFLASLSQDWFIIGSDLHLPFSLRRTLIH